MLINDLMPVFETSETQEINVAAGREAVFRAVQTFDMNDSTTIRWMFKMRGISAKTITLADMEKVNFKILSQRAPEELVVGLAGKFEKLGDKLIDIAPENFTDFREPGFIKAAWNFFILENGARSSQLLSEIRINTTDAKVEDPDAGVDAALPPPPGADPRLPTDVAPAPPASRSASLVGASIRLRSPVTSAAESRLRTFRYDPDQAGGPMQMASTISRRESIQTTNWMVSMKSW